MDGRSVLVLGGSAGALDPLAGILASLPEDFTLPVLVAIHVPRGRPSALVSVLQPKCRVAICDAEDKAPLVPARVYVAPPDYHMLVDEGPCLSLSVDELVNFSRPSIDVLFESAAELLGAGVIAVLLSGANEDGARGMRAVVDAGGLGIAQAPEEAVSRTMPESAIARCPQLWVARASEIAEGLRSVRRGSHPPT